VQRAGAARHVALHVLHARGGFQREPAGVEGDRLADEAEVYVRMRRLRRRVADDDQPRLAAAPTADRGERAHAELVELGRAEHVGGEMLVLGRERDGVLAERVRVELVRRRVREVAGAVRALRQKRSALRGGAELRRLGVTDDDPVEPA
jgi:hypothetical protein